MNLNSNFTLTAVFAFAVSIQGCSSDSNFNGRSKKSQPADSSNAMSKPSSEEAEPDPTVENPAILKKQVEELKTDAGLLAAKGNLTSIIGIGFEDSGTDRDFNDMSFCLDMNKVDHISIVGRTIKIASNSPLKITILRLGGAPSNPYSAEIKISDSKGLKSVFKESMTKGTPKEFKLVAEPGSEIQFFLHLDGERIVTPHTSTSKALVEKGSCRNTGT